jgi:Asp-tRNA(Asn)/Glu-tRNA(Gln) amidotransferase A subunit family amidase
MGRSPHVRRQSAAYRRPITNEGDQMTTRTEHDAHARSNADDELAFAGVARLGELLSHGQVTPRELTEFYLTRIERHDSALSAFISVRAERASPRGFAAPAPQAEISRGAGALRSFHQGSPYVCYTPPWNYVGQPAASIPAGFDGDGLPMAIQLAGAPHSETTIISLAAELEAARPWTQQRPTPGRTRA